MQTKYRNGLWPMQYVFLIRSRAGGKKYVTRRISYRRRSSVSKTRIAWARDCFYICKKCQPVIIQCINVAMDLEYTLSKMF